ncbi:hypothetical protein K7H20_22480 [Salipiger manganoxidans]|uniref:hypothetical protein n=1 Tax=Salipiger marinus TaxID=555512 RepID=UPI001E4000E8|nr:hypothetical protein [Salipiger manganoxidans]MCD1620829.1 hypothetical protein [Salipiger manganoxidans]
MHQLDLFAPQPPRLEPVDPNGPVIQGEPDIVLRLPHSRLAWALAEIELHQHEDGRWMWATGTCGGGYKVGPKWGKFAATQQEATRYAAAELLDRARRLAASPSSYCVTKPQAKSIADFARGFL